MHLSKRRNPVYFNCNTKAIKQKYQICCIGEVHRDDLPQIACLNEELIPYLLKVDEFLRLTKADNRRLTGRGISLFVPNEPEEEPEEAPDDELELSDLW